MTLVQEPGVARAARSAQRRQESRRRKQVVAGQVAAALCAFGLGSCFLAPGPGERPASDGSLQRQGVSWRFAPGRVRGQSQRGRSLHRHVLQLQTASLMKEGVHMASWLGAISWGKLGALIVLQQRFFPKAWHALQDLTRHLRTRPILVQSPAELQAIQEALTPQGKLCRDIEVGGLLLPTGASISPSLEEMSRELPCKIRVTMPKDDKVMSKWRLICANILACIARGEEPLLLWGWCQLSLQLLLWTVAEFAPKFAKYHTPTVTKVSFVVTQTALAWYLHQLATLWRDRRSRGRAEITDVMGWQSSQREAQVNALKTLIQVVVWTVYSCGVMWTAGLQLGKILVLPSVTAVVIGWVGREVVANILASVILHLTQPFAQGDWVSLEGHIDGWVQDVGTFYTRVVQWDKRPIYVPNFKLMTMNVQNNSRMTHRRVLYELKLRLRDIPKIPQIVQEIQAMIMEHEDVDNVQHRLVRWREIGDYSANIWVSCYTKPNMEGIRLATYTAVQQSILERCSAIIYKHGAEFANLTERLSKTVDSDSGGNSLQKLGNVLTDKLAETFSSAREPQSALEDQLQSREQVLRRKEKELKERERELEGEAAALIQRDQEVAAAQEKYRQLLAKALAKKEGGKAKDSTEELQPSADALAGSGATLGAALLASAAAESPVEVNRSEAAEGAQPEEEPLFKDLAGALAAAEAQLSHQESPAEPAEHPHLQKATREDPAEVQAGHSDAEAHSPAILATHGNEAPSTISGTAVVEVIEVTHDGEPPQAPHHEIEAQKEAVKERKDRRIPVKEMGD